MKRIYLYVPDGDEITVDSVIIWLRVGSSTREVVEFSLLENYALDNDQFLRVRDDVTDEWLDYRCGRLFEGSQLPHLYLKSVCMGIHEVYRRTINGTLESFVKAQPDKPSRSQMINVLDPYYFPKHCQSLSNTTCPRGKRKYLSHNLATTCLMATLPFTLMLVVGAIDRLGELIINFLF